MVNFAKIFRIEHGDVVSITGAGGKTTLMYLLGEFFDKSLMTTTTKLLLPQNKKLFIGASPACIDGSMVIAKKKVGNKLHGFNCSELSMLYPKFDYTFIEADGAGMKSLKGWNETEPVICGFSNKTIGIVDITTLSKPTEPTVFRIEEYKKITKYYKYISIDNLVDIVLSKNGLFKNSKYKILYINKVENIELVKKTSKLVSKLINDPRFHLDRIVFGSTVDESYKLAYDGNSVT